MTRANGIRLSVAAVLVLLVAGCADITGPGLMDDRNVTYNTDDPPPERGIKPVGG